jgi:branched-chain amino acid transport system ATP-binding protein
MSLLEIERLTGGYPGPRVLDGVEMAVDEGGVLCLLGRNGAGKTTLVHTVMGMLAGSGSVRFDGRELLGRRTHEIARSGLAIVPQGRRVFGPLTVEENLRIAGSRAPRGARWRSDSVFALFPRLAERRRNFADQLSGGEQEMLSIGRALVTNPRLLVMDEPSDGLAPSIVNLVGEVVDSLRAQGVTVLLVEQNLALALRVADKVAVMGKGRIVFSGAPSDLREDAERMKQLLGVG